MKTSEKAPRRRGSTSSAVASKRVVGVAREERGDERGVRGVAARELAAALAAVALGDEVDELGGVGEVAVVPEGHGPGRGGAERGLRVLPRHAARGRVAAVPDGDVPRQGVEGRLVEDLGDEAHVLVDEDLLAVARRDARRLLAAVLQRVEPEVGELGDLLAGRPDTEDAAGVLGAFLAGHEVVVEKSISAGATYLSVPQRASEGGSGRAGGRRPAVVHGGVTSSHLPVGVSLRGNAALESRPTGPSESSIATRRARTTTVPGSRDPTKDDTMRRLRTTITLAAAAAATALVLTACAPTAVDGSGGGDAGGDGAPTSRPRRSRSSASPCPRRATTRRRSSGARPRTARA